MISWAANGFAAILGLAGGLAVGSGFVALIIVLDIIPRLAQLAFAYRKSIWFESSVILGAVYWSLADFMDWRLSLPRHLTLAFMGLFDGIFVGMLAAALTEVMNVLPILAKRLNLSSFTVWLVTAMVLGKIVGSLFDWLYFQWPE
ncbi:stage V sporulation protein AB [Paenibacillus sepulcri]|uniref:Stage V sporulation protein AB n=1 Tax=Paenibacillus sepulcri TaxID=359917 RepID=A0ABS7CBW1_9BACL|nr:stage V sporulation protein AB [Paenibacillus sepulcri]